MARKTCPKEDPIEQEIVRALCPGEFIAERESFSFTSDLDEVVAKIGKLTATEPARAVSLYETFIACCYEKAEEIHDSDGSFGQCVQDIVCGWIGARQATGADPDETATRMLALMDDDPYCLCYGLEKSAAGTLNKPGLAAFIAQARARFDAAAARQPESGGASTDSSEYLRRHWGDALRTLYLAQRNIAAYAALAEETGVTAQDCHAVATLLVARRKPEEALAWVERGLGFDGKRQRGSISTLDLAMLKRKILVKLGREDDALDAAWADYRAHPSAYSYQELMKFVPKDERSKWHERAIAEAKGADLHSIIELLLDTKELERLADLVRRSEDSALEGLSHYSAEPAAKKLEKAHPESAARMWRAQGFRIVKAKKSRYYDAAVSNFGNAKRCFDEAGLGAEWEKTVAVVRADHHRKKGFMAGFDGLVAGVGRKTEPSFLERAKKSWDRRHMGDDDEQS